jgi:hypothetical protein
VGLDLKWNFLPWQIQQIIILFFTKTFLKENSHVKETEFFLEYSLFSKLDFSKLINNSALGLQN